MNKNKLQLLLLLLVITGAYSFHPKKENENKAIEFINALTEEQKTKAVFSFTEMSRYEFSFLPVYMIPRRGIQLKELDSIQKIKLNELLQSYLSDDGYSKIKNIMSLEDVLRDLEKNNGRDPGLYTVSFYGMPRKDSTWGWKFEGHHISLNFTIIKNQVVFAPFFLGANPAEVKEGPQKGLRSLKDEEDEAFTLINMLTEKQKQKAIFSLQPLIEIATSNASEVTPLQPAGILVKEMSSDQKKQLDKLLGTYLSSMPPLLAKNRMKKIANEDMNELRFGWAGATEPGKPHYYRIQGKNFLVEFDNTQNKANHIHTVWRDFYGDFGRDLLREHYHNTKHPH